MFELEEFFFNKNPQLKANLTFSQRGITFTFETSDEGLLENIKRSYSDISNNVCKANLLFIQLKCDKNKFEIFDPYSSLNLCKGLTDLLEKLKKIGVIIEKYDEVYNRFQETRDHLEKYYKEMEAENSISRFLGKI